MSNAFKFDIEPGATFRASFIPGDEDESGEITDWNLDGLIFTLIIRDSRHCEMLSTALTKSDGRVWIELSPEQTARLTRHNSFRYVIDCLFPSGDIVRLFNGTMYSRAV